MPIVGDWLRRGGALAMCSVAAGVLSSCRDPAEPGDGLEEVWFRPETGAGFTRTRPLVRGTNVIFGSSGGRLMARDIETGEARWTTTLCGAGGPQGRSFVIANGSVLVLCGEVALAVDPATGQIRWSYSPPPDTTYDDLPGVVAGTHPSTDGTDFFIPAWGASVSAVSAATGVVRWVWRSSPTPSDTAINVFRSAAKGTAVSGDTVFVTMGHFTNPKGGTSEAILLALDRNTGAELWRVVLTNQTAGGAISAPPLLVNDFVVALSHYGELFAVRRSTGMVAWKYRSPNYAFGTLAAPVAVGDTIYASLGDERLTALLVSNAQIIWSAPPSGATKDLLATEKYVYVPRDGKLNIHDRATGALIATGRVKGTEGGAFLTAAAAKGTQIFITSSEGAWSFREP